MLRHHLPVCQSSIHIHICVVMQQADMSLRMLQDVCWGYGDCAIARDCVELQVAIVTHA